MRGHGDERHEADAEHGELGHAVRAPVAAWCPDPESRLESWTCQVDGWGDLERNDGLRLLRTAVALGRHVLVPSQRTGYVCEGARLVAEYVKWDRETRWRLVLLRLRELPVLSRSCDHRI